MHKLIPLLVLHAYLAWLARQDAAAQVRFVAKLEADLHAAKRGIPIFDLKSHEAAKRLRATQADLRAHRLAKRFN